ncbi:MAG: type II toxin-antitoxin system HicB family antitoxin [Hyphomicrobium sp.]
MTCATLPFMQSKALTYTLELERHDDGYLASFPALPGCNTWGTTYEAAIRHAEEALAVYLETLEANGDPLPLESDIDAPVSLGITIRTPIIA